MAELASYEFDNERIVLDETYPEDSTKPHYSIGFYHRQQGKMRRFWKIQESETINCAADLEKAKNAFVRIVHNRTFNILMHKLKAEKEKNKDASPNQ